MTTLDRPTTATHEVVNQVPPLVGHDTAQDPVLLAGVEREGAGWAVDELHRLGRLAGSEEAQRWADQANRYEPVLHTVDRYGHRVDEVEFHPAWHSLMDVAVSGGLAGAPWADARPGAHVARAAGSYAWGQVEAGHGCPVSMTYAVVPALRTTPSLAAVYEPLLTSRTYDPGLRVPTGKAGLLAGMGMTEKQGGSDVRANTHHRDRRRATAPGCCAATSGSPARRCATCSSCSRRRPAGCPASSCRACSRTAPATPSASQRLKDKLGNRCNASSEPEFDGTVAHLVGEEGRGVRTIIEMVAMTRLDCVIGSASGMRAALVQAAHHARHRQRLRRTARRQAADARRARRPAARERGGHDAGAAPGRSRRPGRARRRRGAGLQAARGRRRQVLGLQAPAGLRRRGAGVPRRQRLRRGLRSAAAVPRGAAELHLGGLGQRAGARRAARGGARAGQRGRVLRRGGPGARRRPAARRRRHRPARRAGRPRGRRAARAPARRADGPRAAGVAARAARARGGRRRVLRLAPGRRLGPRVRHAPARRRHVARSPRGCSPTPDPARALLRQLEHRLRGEEVLVLAEVADRLDAERLAQRLRVVLGDAGQRADRARPGSRPGSRTRSSCRGTWTGRRTRARRAPHEARTGRAAHPSTTERTGVTCVVASPPAARRPVAAPPAADSARRSCACASTTACGWS